MQVDTGASTVILSDSEQLKIRHTSNPFMSPPAVTPEMEHLAGLIDAGGRDMIREVEGHYTWRIAA